MSLFRTVRSRIRWVFVSCALLFGLASGFGALEMNLAVNRYQSLIEQEAAIATQVRQMQVTFKTQVHEWKNLLLRGQSRTDFDKHFDAFTQSEAKVQAMAAELEPKLPTRDEQAALRQFAEAHKKLGQEYREALSTYLSNGLDPRIGDGAMQGKDRPVSDRLDALAIKYEQTLMTQAAETLTFARLMTVVSTVAGLSSFVIAAILIMLFITRNLSRRLDLLVKQFHLVSKGDFRASVVAPLAKENSPDEIGELTRSFIGMHTTVRNLLGEMTRTSLALSEHASQMQAIAGESAQAAHQVAEAMGSVAAGASTQASNSGEAAQTVSDLRRAVAEIAVGAQEQAAAVEQTMGTVEQMVGAIDAVAANSAGVAESTAEAGERAAAGAKVVERTIRSMQQIERTVQSSATKLTDLGRYSTQIGEITNVITEIADQTNLLALNAAIEAARAGEHGRGFAVVADEVRKLAERAAKSASEITGLVQTIQQATGASIKAMEQGTTEVKEGAQMAAEAGSALNLILAAAEGTTQAVQEISAAAQQLSASSREVARAFERVSAISMQSTAATEEMSAGADEVTGTITRVAEISQENAASAEEVSASIEEITASTEEVASAAQTLQKVADELRVQVQRFRL